VGPPGHAHGPADDDLTDIVPGTEKVLFAKDAGMGEGAHFYKIDGKYYIISANYAGGFRMPAARADKSTARTKSTRPSAATRTSAWPRATA
jgi:beta-xylosidase